MTDEQIVSGHLIGLILCHRFHVISFILHKILTRIIEMNHEIKIGHFVRLTFVTVHHKSVPVRLTGTLTSQQCFDGSLVRIALSLSCSRSVYRTCPLWTRVRSSRKKRQEVIVFGDRQWGSREENADSGSSGFDTS